MNNNRVVITGLGAVTPIGTRIENFWNALLAGRNRIGKITQFDTTGFRSLLAEEVKDINEEEWMDKKSVGRMDRFTHFALAASIMAIKDSGLDSFNFDGN